MIEDFPLLRSPQVAKYAPYKQAANDAQVRLLEAAIWNGAELWKKIKSLEALAEID